MGFQRERLRQKLATLVNAHQGEIAFIPNTTMGIVHIAHCLKWKREDRILLFHGEFPTNITPWQQAAQSFGCETLFVSVLHFWKDKSLGLEKVEGILKEGCRLLAISAVQFQNGLRMPLEEIGSLCRQYDCLFFVDAIQACGALPLDVEKQKIDFLSCGSHKWLMALEGSGFLYIRQDKIDQLQPRTAGWLSHQEGLSFLFEGEGLLRYDRPIKRNASFVENGALNSAGLAALEASVDLLLHLGIEQIEKHIQDYIDLLDRGLQEVGFESLRVDHGRSSILSLYPPEGVDVGSLCNALLERGIACTMPDGKLRMAPHWPNSIDEVPEIIKECRELTGK